MAAIASDDSPFSERLRRVLHPERPAHLRPSITPCLDSPSHGTSGTAQPFRLRPGRHARSPTIARWGGVHADRPSCWTAPLGGTPCTPRARPRGPANESSAGCRLSANSDTPRESNRGTTRIPTLRGQRKTGRDPVPRTVAFGLVAKVVSAASRSRPLLSNADVYRICPLFFSAVPVWQFWQDGSSSHPLRFAAATWLITPWQLWHCISMLPFASTALPIAPRRHFVSDPGWHV